MSAPSIAPCLSGVRARLIGGDFFEKNRENKKLDENSSGVGRLKGRKSEPTILRSA
jgi:hypothetical protein